MTQNWKHGRRWNETPAAKHTEGPAKKSTSGQHTGVQHPMTPHPFVLNDDLRPPKAILHALGANPHELKRAYQPSMRQPHCPASHL